MPTATQSQILTALPSRPIALAYGRHVVAGNVILRNDGDVETDIFVGLGEGPWDSVEQIIVNGRDFTLDPGRWHFHPGTAGEAGSGSVGGDQKVDAFWPVGLEPQLTFSHTAYIALRLQTDDPESPIDGFEIQGIYKCLQLGIYDAGGGLIDTVWSTNGVWQVLDVLLRTGRGPRIDWASFAGEAPAADALGFESHPFFADLTNLGTALQAMLNTFRGFLVDDGGLIGIRIDRARSTVHSFQDVPPSNIAQGSVRPYVRDIRDSTNRLNLIFRDLDNNFAQAPLLGEREWAQDLAGNVNEAALDLFSMRQPQARKLGEYLMHRTLEGRQMARLTGFQDALALLPGDLVGFTHVLGPWEGAKAFEVIEVTNHPDETNALLLQEYDEDAFPEIAEAGQDLGGGLVVSGLDPPGDFVFVVEAPGTGLVVFRAFIFAPLDRNARAIHTGRFANFFVDERLPPRGTLAGAIDATQTTLTLDTPHEPLVVGQLLNIDGEILEITDISGDPVYTVERGEQLSTAAAHSSGAKVWWADLFLKNVPFPPNFFGSGDAASWQAEFELPSARVLTGNVTFWNRAGRNDPEVVVNYSSNTPGFEGLRTLTGGQVDITVNGAIAVANNLDPPGITIDRDASLANIQAFVQTADGAGSLTIRINHIYQSVTTVLGTVTFSAGQTSSSILDGDPRTGIIPVQEGAVVTIDCTEVTGTWSDLRVRMRYGQEVN